MKKRIRGTLKRILKRSFHNRIHETIYWKTYPDEMFELFLGVKALGIEFSLNCGKTFIINQCYRTNKNPS